MPKSKQKFKYKNEASARKLNARGLKISAILIIKRANRLGLKEAKDIVESWGPPAKVNQLINNAIAAVHGDASGGKSFAGTYPHNAGERSTPLFQLHQNDEGYWIRIRPLDGAEACYYLGNPSANTLSKRVLNRAMAIQPT